MMQCIPKRIQWTTLNGPSSGPDRYRRGVTVRLCMSASEDNASSSVDAIASSVATTLSIGSSSSNSTSSSPQVTVSSSGAGGNSAAAAAPASEQHLGLSLEAFRHFLSSNPTIAANSLTTEDIKHRVIAPATASTGRAFIHMLEDKVDSSGRPFVAPATTYVLHAWKYKFVEVVLDVLEQHATERPDAYFWFDLFTVDQNKVGSVASLTEAVGFRGPILATRHVLVVLHPWTRPIPLKRAWCLLEMFSSIETAGITLEGKLPRDEAEFFEECVREGDIEGLGAVISRIQAEKAVAFDTDDLDKILSVFRETPGGFDHVNKVVKTFMNDWFTRQLLALSDAADEADSDLFYAVGLAFMTLGDFERGIVSLERTLRIKLAALGDMHPKLAELYSFLGNAYSSKDAPEKAIENFEMSLRINIIALGGEHPQVAAAYNNVGLALEKKGDTKQAVESFKKAVTASGPSNPDAELYASNLERVSASAALAGAGV